jgi:predicted O-methyltransferase YrrM
MWFNPSMWDSAMSVLFKRLGLVIKGNHHGVNINYLLKSTDGMFLSTKDFQKSKVLHELLEDDFSNEAQILFDKFKAKGQSIASDLWDAEFALFSLIFTIIKCNNFSLIVETGVANGATTNAIMSALEGDRSGGSLHSFDILPQAASAYGGQGNWIFHLLPTRSAHKEIERTVSTLQPSDLWIHDSDHGYRWQKFEYLLALKHLKPGGILISDDIDASPAWGELAETHFRKSFVVFDSRKLIGIALK